MDEDIRALKISLKTWFLRLKEEYIISSSAPPPVPEFPNTCFNSKLFLKSRNDEKMNED